MKEEEEQGIDELDSVKFQCSLTIVIVIVSLSLKDSQAQVRHVCRVYARTPFLFLQQVSEKNELCVEHE